MNRAKVEENPVCFLCGLESEYLPSISGKDLVGIRCKRCCDYYLDGFLIACGISDKKNDKAILSGYAKWEHTLRKLAPIIAADNIDRIVHENKNYPEVMKVDKLLIYYSIMNPNKGSNIEFVADLEFPITFSINSVEFVYLLEKVAFESCGFIEVISIASPLEGYFRITPKGWGRIEKLKKAILADDKYEIENARLLSSLRMKEAQLKEQAGLEPGKRHSTPLARDISSLYIKGLMDKLDMRMRIDREIILGPMGTLEEEDSKFLLMRISRFVEYEKENLKEKLAAVYEDCHVANISNGDITKAFSEIDNHLKMKLVDLQILKLAAVKSRPLGLSEIDTKELITKEESKTLEFKSSFQWDIKLGRENKELRKEVIETLVAFNNTEGGYLIIGVSDDKTILGLDNDYSLIRHPNKEDIFLQGLCRAIENATSIKFVSLIDIQFPKIEDKYVCKIKVEIGDEPVYVKENQKEEAFYIKTHNSVRKLSLSETISYIKTKWR